MPRARWRVPALDWSTRSPWGWVVWQLAAVGVIALLASGVRFGPVRRAIERRRRSPLEHVRALATALAAARGHDVAVRLMVQGLRRRLSRGGRPARARPGRLAREPRALGADARGREALQSLTRTMTRSPPDADERAGRGQRRGDPVGGAEAVMTTALTPLGADDAARAAEDARAIVEQLGRVVLGQEAALRDAVAALIARGHVLLEGVPGTAKTLLVRALSQVLRPRVPPDPVHAGPDALGHHRRESARRGQAPSPSGRARSSATWCWATRSTARPAKTQAALLEAMQERRVTVDGVSHALPDELHGLRHPEPDRIRGHLSAARGGARPLPGEGRASDYPGGDGGAGDPARVLGGFEADIPASYGVRPVADAAEARALREACRRVRVEPSLVAYITAIVRATRSRAGAHARRLAPRQRRAAQDGAGLGAARRPGVRRSRRREGARARRAPPPGDGGARSWSWRASRPDTALRGIIEKIEAPR